MKNTNKNVMKLTCVWIAILAKESILELGILGIWRKCLQNISSYLANPCL